MFFTLTHNAIYNFNSIIIRRHYKIIFFLIFCIFSGLVKFKNAFMATKMSFFPFSLCSLKNHLLIFPWFLLSLFAYKFLGFAFFVAFLRCCCCLGRKVLWLFSHLLKENLKKTLTLEFEFLSIFNQNKFYKNWHKLKITKNDILRFY